MLTYAICAAVLVTTVGSSLGQAVNNVTLSLRREYGRARYRQCRLDITVSDGKGRTALECTYNIEPPQTLRAERVLEPAEMNELSTLVGASDLCTGGHIGRDDRASDGVLETLMTACSEARVAVLVTSGNSTFNTNKARRRLIERIHALEAELGEATRPPK
jgi:hypothetical protein